MPIKRIIVIGGGAAGFFGALSAAESHPDAEVIIFEKSPKLLTKVAISGGGRCNVTHHCFDPNLLATHYPRGERELMGPFHRFQPKDTLEWFLKRGVRIKAEDDGRMFPISDDSKTIIDCFMKEVEKLGIKIFTRTSIDKIESLPDHKFRLSLSPGNPLICDTILLATGGGQSNKGYDLAKSLGHTIIDPVSSLFTFNIEDPRIEGLMGISFPLVNLSIPNTSLSAQGPLLITHWGLSGPAILRLSAWGARILHDLNYNFDLKINFVPQFTTDSILLELKNRKLRIPQKQISKNPLFDLTMRFRESVVAASNISENLTWSHISSTQLHDLANQLTQATYKVTGKSTYKEEFVTAGGISLKEVNFKTMESKKVPGLFFAGEVLDIDGITGGFNFQAAWTCSWIAGKSM